MYRQIFKIKGFQRISRNINRYSQQNMVPKEKARIMGEQKNKGKDKDKGQRNKKAWGRGNTIRE